MDPKERARLLVLNMPRTINPLLVAMEWVHNLGRDRFHLTVDGCPYGVLIRIENREYQDETPPHEKMCGFCRQKWERARREAA